MAVFSEFKPLDAVWGVLLSVIFACLLRVVMALRSRKRQKVDIEAPVADDCPYMWADSKDHADALFLERSFEEAFYAGGPTLDEYGNLEIPFKLGALFFRVRQKGAAFQYRHASPQAVYLKICAYLSAAPVNVSGKVTSVVAFGWDSVPIITQEAFKDQFRNVFKRTTLIKKFVRNKNDTKSYAEAKCTIFVDRSAFVQESAHKFLVSKAVQEAKAHVVAELTQKFNGTVARLASDLAWKFAQQKAAYEHEHAVQKSISQQEFINQYNDISQHLAVKAEMYNRMLAVACAVKGNFVTAVQRKAELAKTLENVRVSEADKDTALKSLEGLNTFLEERCYHLVVGLDAVATERDQLRAECEELKAERVTMQERIDTLSSEIEDLKAELDADPQGGIDELIEKERKIRYIMDRFGVSDAAYHELTQLFEFLPRSYRLKRLRADMNKEYYDTMGFGNTPNGTNGRQVDVMKMLNEMIADLFKSAKLTPTNENIAAPGEAVKIFKTNLPVILKLNGDGAKMSRLKHLVLLSFACVNRGWSGLTGSNNKVMAAMDMKESYEELKKGLQDVLAQINQLVKDGFVIVDHPTDPAAKLKVRGLWVAFNMCVDTLHVPYGLTDAEIDLFEARAKAFVESFSAAGKEAGQHGYKDITPYMHCFAVHLPGQLRTVRTGLIMSCQGTERTNDFARKVLQGASNGWNYIADVMTFFARLQGLQDDCERTPRARARPENEKEKAENDVWKAQTHPLCIYLQKGCLGVPDPARPCNHSGIV